MTIYLSYLQLQEEATGFFCHFNSERVLGLQSFGFGFGLWSDPSTLTDPRLQYKDLRRDT